MSEPGAVTTEQCDAEDKTNKKEPMHCPLQDGGIMLVRFDNVNDIDNFHKAVDSPLDPLCDDEEEKFHYLQVFLWNHYRHKLINMLK